MGKKKDLLDKEKLVQIKSRLSSININKMAEELEIGSLTLEDIINE